MEKDLHLATSVPAVFSPPTCSLIWHKSICLDTYLFCILHPQKYRETIRRHFTFLWTSTPHVLVSDCRLQSTCSYWRCRKTSTSNLTALCLAYSPCEFQYSGSPVKIMFSDGGWLLKGAPFTAVGAYFIQEHCAHKLLPLEPKVASLLLYLRNLLPRCAWRLRMHQICSTVICFPYGNHSIVLMHPSYKQLCSARGQNSFFMSCYKGYGNSQFSLFLHSENLLRGTQKQSCRYCVGVIPCVAHEISQTLGETLFNTDFLIYFDCVVLPSGDLPGTLTARCTAVLHICSKELRLWYQTPHVWIVLGPWCSLEKCLYLNLVLT